LSGLSIRQGRGYKVRGSISLQSVLPQTGVSHSDSSSTVTEVEHNAQLVPVARNQPALRCDEQGILSGRPRFINPTQYPSDITGSSTNEVVDQTKHAYTFSAVNSTLVSSGERKILLSRQASINSKTVAGAQGGRGNNQGFSQRRGLGRALGGRGRGTNLSQGIHFNCIIV